MGIKPPGQMACYWNKILEIKQYTFHTCFSNNKVPWIKIQCKIAIRHQTNESYELWYLLVDVTL